MSTCPEKDIHSIYLDNELPAAYVAEYEAHIAACPECKAKLEKLRMMHKVFSQDSKSMELSQRDLDDSFNRLQARLSYSRHTKDERVLTFTPKKAVYALAGAAAALAVFVLPSQLMKKPEQKMEVAEQVPPMALATKVSYPSNVPIHMDGEISPESLGNLFADGEVVDTDVGISPLRTQIGTMGYTNPGITTAGMTTQNNQNSMVFKINGQDAFVLQPGMNQVQAVQGQEGDEDKNTFSVEFSFGQFHFKAQGDGK
ncbi:MAG: zf-HC2 domain-containing protein [Treponema sp.]|nr:zf-HC2 domain-containing protein [Treponema sp.]